jgi:hypothetical protein
MKTLSLLTLLMLSAQVSAATIECVGDQLTASAKFKNGVAELKMPANKTDEVYSIKVTQGVKNKNFIYAIKKVDLVDGTAVKSFNHTFNLEDQVTIEPGLNCIGIH